MTTRDDPLNDLILPAYDRAVKIRDGEKNVSRGEILLAGAVLAMIAERDALWALLRHAERQHVEERKYAKELEKEASPAAVDRARGVLRLHSKEVFR